jgi:hypothetical protein
VLVSGGISLRVYSLDLWLNMLNGGNMRRRGGGGDLEEKVKKRQTTRMQLSKHQVQRGSLNVVHESEVTDMKKCSDDVRRKEGPLTLRSVIAYPSRAHSL